MRPRRRIEQTLPTSVVCSLVYVGVIRLLFLGAYSQLSRRSLWADFAWLWWAHEEGSRTRWLFATIGCLLVLYLWSQGRDLMARRVWPQATACLLAAVLLLALHWAVLTALTDSFQALKYELVQVHP